MSQDLAARIIALHEWYCRNIGAMRLTPQVEKLWFDWLKAGYNGNDLRDVIRYLRRQIAVGKRNEGALKLCNLIAPGELGYVGFDQDLCLARARANLNIEKKLEPAPDSSPSPLNGLRAEPRRENDSSPAGVRGEITGTSPCTPTLSTPAEHTPNTDALRKLRDAAS